MCSLVTVPPVPVRTKFSAVDAARLALARGPRPRPSTPPVERRLGAATALWCRDLQFPSVGAIGEELGLTSSSSVATGSLERLDVAGLRRVLEAVSTLPVTFDDLAVPA